MANTFALVIGAVYLVAGLVGFILAPAGGVLLGIFPVNTFHHIFHLTMAVLALAAGWQGRGRLFCRIAGVVFLLLGVLGILTPLLIAPVLAHPGADLLTDNLLHLMTGIGLIYFGLLPEAKTPRQRASVS